MPDNIPLVCSLPGPGLAARRQEVIEPLFHAVQKIEELPDGYGLTFPSAPDGLSKLAEFITFERACCPFFIFELICEPEQGPIRLNIRGPEGAKAFLQAELPGLGENHSS